MGVTFDISAHPVAELKPLVFSEFDKRFFQREEQERGGVIEPHIV